MRVLMRLLASTAGRLLVLLLLVLTAVVAGATVVTVTGDFESYPEAAWWAFHHIADPGALGDDEEWDERIVGTALMVTGIVVFVGVILSLVIETVQRLLERAEEQPPVIRASEHLVILGWGSLTPVVLDELGLMKRQGQPIASRVVVVAPASLRGEKDRLAAELRSHRHEFATDLRFAEVDDPEVLVNVAVRSASSVVIVPNDLGAADPLAADLDVIARGSLLANVLGAEAGRPKVGYLVVTDQALATATRSLPDHFRSGRGRPSDHRHAASGDRVTRMVRCVDRRDGAGRRGEIRDPSRRDARRTDPRRRCSRSDAASGRDLH